MIRMVARVTRRIPELILLKLVAVFVVLATALCFAGCGRNTATPIDAPVSSVPPPSTTYPMPPLNGKSLNKMGWSMSNGKRGVFADYKGQVLLLDFYATWCEPCRNSVPHLVQLQHQYEKQGLHVVGLNVGGAEDLDQVPAFAREFQIQYDLAVPDDDLNAFLLSDDTDIPQTFIFDRRGLLIKRLKGFGGATGQEIDEAVANAIKSAAE